MRRETADLIGSGLLLIALVLATMATLAPTSGAGVAGSGTTVAADGLVDRGRSLFFAKGCVSCHRIAGVSEGSGIGPDLSSLELRAASQRPGLSAAEYVRESIRTPNAFLASTISTVYMPDLGLSDEEIEALTAFLLAPDAK